MRSHLFKFFLLSFFCWFLLAGCRLPWLDEGLTILVTDSYGGPTVSGAEIRLIEGLFDQRGKMVDLPVTAEKIPGKLLGKTDESGSFSFNPDALLSSPIFSLVITKEKYAASIIQDFYRQRKREILEVVIHPIAGEKAMPSVIWFNEITPKDRPLLFSKELIRNPIKASSSDRWKVLCSASYPMLRLEKKGVGLSVGFGAPPSGLFRFFAKPLEVAMEKKLVGQKYEETDYYTNQYEYSFESFFNYEKIQGNTFLYLVCHDIMGNRVQTRIPILLDAPASGSNQYYLSQVELRTFASNRALYSLKSSQRSTTGYAILTFESFEDTSNRDGLNVHLFARPESNGKKPYAYELIGTSIIPRPVEDNPSEVVFASGFFQPNRAYEFLIKVYDSSRALRSWKVEAMSMLPEIPIVNYKPSGGGAVPKTNCTLSFQIENWETLKDQEFSYRFSIDLKSLDGLEKLRTYYVIDHKEYLLPIQFIFLNNNPKKKSGIYLYSKSLFPDLLYREGSFNGKISIDILHLMDFLERRGFDLGPSNPPQKFKPLFSSGKAYQWAVSGGRHGAEFIVYWKKSYPPRISTSHAASVETDGIGEGSKAFFYIE